MAMEDHSGRQLCVGLDITAPEQLADVERLLQFAEISCRRGLAEADILVGDGGNPSARCPYIYITDICTPPPDSLSCPLLLNPLLAVLSQAASLTGIDRHPNNEVFARYVGTSDAAVSTRQQIASAAHRDVTVLVTGESGTGKEVVARALHDGSSRASGPFVPVNCGAIPAELLESELFGHERGAFTGAITQKSGRFELAHGGTLFLDEIGDIPYAMQVKLLRAIEQKSFERIGGTVTKVSDARIVSATNKDLEASIAAGEFREDLFYRLNVFPIELSPLRRRIEDIPLLVNTLVAKIQQEQGLLVRLSVDALSLLSQYHWPGNVRELANLLNRLAIQFPNALVRSVDLPKKYCQPSAREEGQNVVQPRADEPGDVLLPINGIDLKNYLARLEKSLIEQALNDSNAVVARAADRLHIRRTTLVEKMRKHGLGRMLEAAE